MIRSFTLKKLECLKQAVKGSLEEAAKPSSLENCHLNIISMVQNLPTLVLYRWLQFVLNGCGDLARGRFRDSESLINRGGRGDSYLIVRGEILGFLKDELLRKHLTRMFSLIKNESRRSEDDQTPS